MDLPKFGAYVHIPFCIQRCGYCDFATYARDQIAPNENYVTTLLSEMKIRRPLFPFHELNTLYFGGGTPSLLSTDQIERLIQGFYELGFQPHDKIEVTLEVNPATLNEEKCASLKAAGVNRISIGCQSFQDRFLKACGREHNVEDTFRTIELVQKYFDNFSLDLLFALPKQTMGDLSKDLATLLQFNPPHVSAYCLTLKPGHPMNQGRPSDDIQVEMFDFVQSHLVTAGLLDYELSNFARPGFESQHNLLYWQDHNYWGLGLSAHSYLRHPDWGARFWNASGYKAYITDMKKLPKTSELHESYSPGQLEKLRLWESLTDFCHTQFRLTVGLNEASLHQKFPDPTCTAVLIRLKKLEDRGLITERNGCWKLSRGGRLLSNQVFSELLFSPEDVDKGLKGLILSAH